MADRPTLFDEVGSRHGEPNRESNPDVDRDSDRESNPEVERDSVRESNPETARLRLVVAYLGTNFHGLAPQPGQRTVCGELLQALTTTLRLGDDPPPITMSGRTDAGVHGWGQVLHIDVPATTAVDPTRLTKSLNKMLGPEITIREIDLAPRSFDARFSALWRRYRYTVLTGPTPDPFLASTAWYVPHELDLAAMRLACDPLLGEHDFSSFCRVPKGHEEPSMTRLLTHADWIDLRAEHPLQLGLLRFEIQASSFCQQMVRAIVGLMIDVGRGRKRAGDIRTIIAARDRSAASPIAPPYGLVLWQVGYPPDVQ